MSDPTGSWIMDAEIWRGLHGSPDITPAIPVTTTTPPTFSASGAGRVNDVALSVPWPTHSTGQIGILVVETNAQTITTPTGWTIFSGAPWSTGTAGAAGSVGLYLFWKRAASSSEGNASVSDSGDHQAARILVFAGCLESGTPIDATIGQDVLAVASTAVTVPTFTTSVDNTRVVIVVAQGSDSAADCAAGVPVNTNLTGLTNHTDTNTAAGNGGGFFVASGVKASAGAVGATTATLLRSAKQVRVQFALLPAAVGTTPTPGSGPTMFGSEGFDEAESTTCSGTTYSDSFASLLGLAVTPDTLISETNATTMMGYIASATTAGAHLIIKVTPSNAFLRYDDNPDRFSVPKWNGLWDAFWAALSGAQKTALQTAVRNGVVRCLYVLDDFAGQSGGNAFTVPVTNQDLDDICQHVKIDAPWMPTFARGALTSLRDMASSGGTVTPYQYLDMGQCAYRPKTDWRVGATRKIADNIRAGQDCGLAALGWNNILNWGTGDSSKNGGFGCIAGDEPNACGESPSEILEACRAALNAVDANGNTLCHGLMLWAYNFGICYWHRSDVQAALATIASEIVSRVEGPNNIRTGTSKHLDPA